MNDVQRVRDLNWRNQVLHHVNCTTVPCVRQLSNSSSDSIGGIVCSMECTGTTASLQGPRTLQVSQVIPADPRAEGARSSAQEGRGNRYPVELRAQGARFSAPPQETCSRPADLRAGNAREAAQATCMPGPATPLPEVGDERCLRLMPININRDLIDRHVSPVNLIDAVGRQRECYSVPVSSHRLEEFYVERTHQGPRVGPVLRNGRKLPEWCENGQPELSLIHI